MLPVCLSVCVTARLPAVACPCLHEPGFANCSVLAGLLFMLSVWCKLLVPNCGEGSISPALLLEAGNG